MLAGAPARPALDEVTAALANGDPEAVLKLRCYRLAAAISNFDAATIATTHSFCQEALAGFGTLVTSSPTSASCRTSRTWSAR